jgi:Xaa-Pro dipeptidase
MMIPKSELDRRLEDFIHKMDIGHPCWDTVFIISKVNQYYLTGTMQDGFIVIKKDGSAVYYVYRSYERAVDESLFRGIRPIKSYRDASDHCGRECGNAFFETDIVSYSMIERLKKYFTFDSINSADKTILSQRAVKTPYELELIRRAGTGHKDFYDNILPYLFREGISEAELYAGIFEKMLKHGSQSLCRCTDFIAEMGIGQVCFGESSIYPRNMDSPDGGFGMSPAVPLFGSRDRKLKKGDLILIDLAYVAEGYHTDKTQLYIFGEKPSAEIAAIHKKCLDILNAAKNMLLPGKVPSAVYGSIMESLDEAALENFMGYGRSKVKFLGHGTGLCIDEYPIVSKGFDGPLETGMVIALEPKMGISGKGMVGAEETYILGSEGMECITGGALDIIEV